MNQITDISVVEPCPFCGHSAKIQFDEERVMVQCRKCTCVVHAPRYHNNTTDQPRASEVALATVRWSKRSSPRRGQPRSKA